VTPQQLEDFLQRDTTRWTTGHYFTVYNIARAMAKTLSQVAALEIGVAHGSMTVAILGGLTAAHQNVKLVSVDEFLGETDSECLPIVWSRLEQYGLMPYWEFHQANSHAWNTERDFDLCVIDGDHTFEGMWQDFRLCANHLNPHGLIIMHDTEVHRGREFIQSMTDDWNHVTIPFYNGLTILRRASDPSSGYMHIEDW